jgi:serine-type D-Ala-D-Ala carboxypeptidase/endopeptidase
LPTRCRWRLVMTWVLARMREQGSHTPKEIVDVSLRMQILMLQFRARQYLKRFVGTARAESLDSAQMAPSDQALSDDEIRKILVERIDVQKKSIGLVVGIIDGNGRRVIARGHPEKSDERVVDGATIFEIGSVTKVFTALLLAEMVERGEVALDDPVSKYLPAGVKVPERGGRFITLVDLATHMSGLPRLPMNLSLKDPANPYADYSVERLYKFLSSYKLPRDIGSKYEYSNLGGGLLGHVLALRAGTTYEALVESRICASLEMKSTAITLTGEMEERLATGHKASLEVTQYWDMASLAGAGALQSSAEDMLAFLAANLGYTKTMLASAMEAMRRVRRATETPGLEIALGWHVLARDDAEIFWHNGGTGGFRSFIGFVPKTGLGVIAFSNVSTPAGVDDIGLRILAAGTLA